MKGEDFGIDIQITGTENRIINNKTNQFIKLKLYSTLSKNTWNLEKNTIEIDKVFIELKSKLISFGRVNIEYCENYSNQDINKNILRFLLNTLVKFPECINSPLVIRFLELENHYSDIYSLTPKLYSIRATDKMYVSDICHKDGVLLVGKKLKVDSIKGQISSMFGKYINIGNSSKTNRGEISMHLVEDDCVRDILSYKTLKPVSKVNTVRVSGEVLVLIGFEDGVINTFKIIPIKIKNIPNNNKNSNSNSPTFDLELISVLTHQKNEILDFTVNPNNGYLYSAALNDTEIKVSEIHYKTLITSIPIVRYGIKNIRFCEEDEIIIVIDNTDTLWVLRLIQNFKVSIFSTIRNISNSTINYMSVNVEMKFVYIANKDNELKILNYSNPMNILKDDDFKIDVRMSMQLNIGNNNSSNDSGLKTNLNKLKNLVVEKVNKNSIKKPDNENDPNNNSNSNNNTNNSIIKVSSITNNSNTLYISATNGSVYMFQYKTEYPEFTISYCTNPSNLVLLHNNKFVVADYSGPMYVIHMPGKSPSVISRLEENSNLNIIDSICEDLNEQYSALELNMLKLQTGLMNMPSNINSKVPSRVSSRKPSIGSYGAISGGGEDVKEGKETKKDYNMMKNIGSIGRDNGNDNKDTCEKYNALSYKPSNTNSDKNNTENSMLNGSTSNNLNTNKDEDEFDKIENKFQNNTYSKKYLIKPSNNNTDNLNDSDYDSLCGWDYEPVINTISDENKILQGNISNMGYGLIV